MKDIRSIISAFLMRMNREATARSWRGSEALRINYLSLSGDNEIDRVYHAVLKDHRSCSGYITGRKFIRRLIRAEITVSFLRDILIQRSRDRRSRRLWRMRIRRCYRRFRMVLMITRR